MCTIASFCKVVCYTWLLNCYIILDIFPSIPMTNVSVPSKAIFWVSLFWGSYFNMPRLISASPFPLCQLLSTAIYLPPSPPWTFSFHLVLRLQCSTCVTKVLSSLIMYWMPLKYIYVCVCTYIYMSMYSTYLHLIGVAAIKFLDWGMICRNLCQ